MNKTELTTGRNNRYVGAEEHGCTCIWSHISYMHTHIHAHSQPGVDGVGLDIKVKYHAGRCVDRICNPCNSAFVKLHLFIFLLKFGQY